MPARNLKTCVVAARKACYADFNRRWIDELSENSKEFYLCASISDPQFKDLSFLDEQDDHVTKQTIRIFSDTWQEYAFRAWKSQYDVYWAEVEKSSPSGSARSTAPEDKAGSVNAASFFSSSGNVVDPTHKHERDTDLLYPAAQMGTDVLAWWKDNIAKLPNVGKMARQYLGVPASSATVERFFSSAGLTHSDLRQKMDDGTLEALF
jgi:hypothetical protein